MKQLVQCIMISAVIGIANANLGPNLLGNGDFESSGFWGAWGDGNTVLSQTDPVEGDKCAAIWYHNNGIFQEIYSVGPGTYELGGHLLAGANLAGKRVVIQAEMKNGGNAEWTQQLNITPGITEDVWHSVSETLVFTKSYDTITFNLMLIDENGASGVGLFDDIYFCQINGDVETERHYYGAKLEPQNLVMHSGGQNIADFWEYWWAMNSDQRRPACYMSYCNLTAPFLPALRQDLERYRRELSDGVYMPVQMGLWLPTNDDTELSKVASGEYDGDIQRFCDDLNKLGYPVYLRIGYECNGSHNGYDPAIYKAAFIRITDALRANNVEAATVFNVIQGPYLAYYPGDDYVDWMSINQFGAGNIQSAYTSALLSDAETRGKPVLIGESGPVYVETTNGQASWDGWFIPYFNMIENWRGIKNFCYINAAWNNEIGWLDCRIHIPEASDVLGWYQSELDSSLYLNGMDEPSLRAEMTEVVDTTAPGKVTDVTVDTVNAPVLLSWTEPADDTGINRYEIKRDGVLVGYNNLPTYEDWDDIVAGTTHAYYITAIDQGGNRGPVSDPIRVVTAPTVEKAINGEFDLGRNPWSATGNGWVQASIDTTSKLSGQNSSKLQIEWVTGNDWELVYHQNLDTKGGFYYELSFQAVADQSTSIRVVLQETHSPWNSFILGTVNLSTTPQTYRLTGWAPDDDNVDLNFLLGATGYRTIWIDSVSVKETSSNPDPYTCADVLAEGVEIVADLTGDCYVDIDDLRTFAEFWLDTNCSGNNNCQGADMETDGEVNMDDLAVLAAEWMNCNNPQDVFCDSTW